MSIQKGRRKERRAMNKRVPACVINVVICVFSIAVLALALHMSIVHLSGKVPWEAVQELVLEQIEQVSGKGIDLEGIRWDPAGEVEIRGLRVTDRRGAQVSPVFTVQEIVLLYNLRSILNGTVGVKLLELRQPHFHMGRESGQPAPSGSAWLPLLVSLPVGVQVEECRVSEAMLTVKKEGAAAVKVALPDLLARGVIGRRQLVGYLVTPEGELDEPNLALDVAADVPRNLTARAWADVRVSQLPAMSFDISGKVSLEDVELQAGRQIHPPDLTADFHLEADGGGEALHISSLVVTFGAANAVKVRGDATHLGAEPEIDLEVYQTSIALEEMSQYLAGVVPSLELDGELEVPSWIIRGSLAQRNAGAPLTMSGTLTFRQVDVALPSAGVEVEGGDGQLEVERLALVRWQPRDAVGTADLSIRRAQLRELSLEGVRGVWRGTAAGASLEEASITGTIEVSRLEVPLGQLGRASTGAWARLELAGDLGRGDLDRLEGEWQVGEVLRGELSGSAVRFGEEGVDLHGSFEADLAALTTLFGAVAETKLPVFSSGTATGRIGVEGKLSTNLAAEPVNVSLGVVLDGVSLEGDALALDGASGRLDFTSGFFSPFILTEPSLQGRVTAEELRAGPVRARQAVLEVGGSADAPVGKGRSAPFACSLRFSGEDWSVSGGAFSAEAVWGDVAAGGIASTGAVEDLEVEANLEARELSISQRLAAEGGTLSFEFDSGGILSRANFPGFSSRGRWTTVGLRGTGVGAVAGSITGTFELTASADEEGTLSELLLEGEADAREIVLKRGVSLGEVDFQAEAEVRGYLLRGESCDVTGTIGFSGSGVQADGGELHVGPFAGHVSFGGAYRLGGFLEDPAVEGLVRVAGLAMGEMVSAGPGELKVSATAEGNLLERAPLHVHIIAEGEGLQSARLGATAAAVQMDYNAEAVLVGGKEVHQPKITGRAALDALTVGDIVVDGQTQIRSETTASGPLQLGEGGTLLSTVQITAERLVHGKPPIALQDVQGSLELPVDVGGDGRVTVRAMRGSVGAGEMLIGEDMGLREVDLRFELESEGLFFESARLSAGLKVGSVVFARENLSLQDEDVEIGFAGTVNLGEREIAAQELWLVAPHWFVLKASGQANLATRAVAFEAEVTELDLARVLAILPADSAAWRPSLTLPRKPSLTISVSGQLPLSAEESALPIVADLRYHMEGAGLSWPERSVRVDELATDCHLTYGEEGVTVEGSLAADVLGDVRIWGGGVGEVTFAYRLMLDNGGRFILEESRLVLPEQGLTVSTSGTVDRGRPWSREDLAEGIGHLLEASRADVSLVGELRAEEEKEVVPGLRVRGLASVDARGRWTPGGPMAVEGKVHLDGVTVWRGTELAIEGINGHFPFAKVLAVSVEPEVEGAAPEVAASEAELAGEGALSFSGLLRPYSRLQNALRIHTIRVGDLTIDEVVGGVLYRDNALIVPRFQARVLDGIVAGHAFVGGRAKGQVVGAAFEFAGVNVKRLPGPLADIPDDAGELRGNVALTLGLMARPGKPGLDVGSIDGEVNITSIGERVVDRLLLFLDPEESNPSVVDSRRRLKYAVPTKVSASIRHGSLSLNLQLKAKALGGKTIEVPTIRRIPLYRLARFSRVQQVLGRLEPVRVGLAALAARAIVRDELGHWVFR